MSDNKTNSVGLLTEISMMMKDTSNLLVHQDDRAETLYALLEDIVYTLGDVATITEDKIDVDFLMMIVASYIVGKNSGDLDDDVKTPTQLFEERIIPIIDNTELEVEKEVQSENS